MAALVGRSPKRSRYRPPDEEHGWHAFGLQDDAFRFVDARPDDNLRVWAAEINRDGGRKYYAANIDEFWRRYRVLKPSFRHFYELIRSGEPCLLYLDLEYDRAANPTCDGERMVATVVALLSEALDAAYGAAPRAADVVDLDSSTERKFSRHVLLRGAAFADNLHLGRFVLAWHAALGARRAARAPRRRAVGPREGRHRRRRAAHRLLRRPERLLAQPLLSAVQVVEAGEGRRAAAGGHERGAAVVFAARRRGGALPALARQRRAARRDAPPTRGPDERRVHGRARGGRRRRQLERRR